MTAGSLDAQPSPLDIPAAPQFDAWRLRPWTVDEFWQERTPNDSVSLPQLRHLAALALLAPTTHNTVPERFELLSDVSRMRLYLDRQRVLPQSDPQGRQATISCGCVLSFLSIATQAYGLNEASLTVEWARDAMGPSGPHEPRYTVVHDAVLTRSPAPTRGLEWVAAMLKRKLVRAEYDPRVALDEVTLHGMNAIVDSHASVRLHVITDPPTLLALGKFQELADTTVFNRPAFARELGNWLLPNDDEAPVGMRGREYGLSDDAALHFHRGLLGQDRLLPDEVAALARTSNRGMRSASAVVVLTVDEDTVRSRLQAGRVFGELLLYLQIRGWATAIHAGITEVDAPNLALRGRLRTTRRPVVVFRIGKPMEETDSQRAHSARPALDDVLLPTATACLD